MTEELTKLEKLEEALKCTEKIKGNLAQIRGYEDELDAILLNYHEEAIYSKISYGSDFFMNEDIYDLPGMLDYLSDEIKEQIRKEQADLFLDKAAKYIHAAAKNECNYGYIVWIKDFYKMYKELASACLSEGDFIEEMDKRLKGMK